jgi:hypothetical protein
VREEELAALIGALHSATQDQLPLSARPGSGSSSNPICKSSCLNLSAVAKLERALRARRAAALAAAPRLNGVSRARSVGANNAGSDLCSGASISPGEDPTALGILPDTVEENRLADTAKAIEDQAARRCSPDAIERDGGSLGQVIAAGQLRRRDASSRCKRVATRVPSLEAYPTLSVEHKLG